ncbi:MAG: response regulator [Verrucomicrobiae bacterium]|nr:response regulator [Verrucomicrobiae bacterium]
MNEPPVRVLLVDDDEDDFVITRDLFAGIAGRRYELDWESTFIGGLAAIQRGDHDVCLLDYRLGAHTGLELLEESKRLGLRPPLILLTGQGDHEIDLEAMKAGAADFLVKGQITAHQLDRAIRYALERTRSEETLRRERDLISRIMETSPVGIVVTDQAGKIIFANHCAEEVLGLTREAIAQRARSVLEWQVADAEGVPQEGRPLPLGQLLAGGPPVVHARHTVEVAGQRIVLSTNATPLFDAVGRSDGLVVTVEDITGRLALQAQLRQSQKMELVGRLAAGVAHDINNILTIIQGHTGLLLQTATADSHTMKSLKQIAAASDRAASFVRHLLMFSRKQVVQTHLIDLNAVLQNLQPMLPRMLGEMITLKFSCQAGLPLLAGDVNMTEQIVMNLAINARDAMPRGGTLDIRTTAVEIPVALARQNPDAYAGKFVCLRVSDTGCGMERRVMQRIFEPFFTTKEVGKGTGLGLSTVYGIVRQHQGWIEVESEIGVGTTFKVFLPAAVAGTCEGPTNQPIRQEAAPNGQETILVVEDELGLLSVVSRGLQQYQYRVLAAGSAADALRVWDEHEGRVDVLLTDMVMPGSMSGNDLVNELRQRKPALKVIITSGYSAELVGRDFSTGDTCFLPKPYQPQAAARLIRQTLDGPGGSAKPAMAIEASAVVPVSSVPRVAQAPVTPMQEVACPSTSASISAAEP